MKLNETPLIKNGHKVIFVLDDDQEDLDVFKRTADKIAPDYFEYFCGSFDALNRLKQGYPAGVITDLVMHPLTGFQIIDLVKASKYDNPLFILTGYAPAALAPLDKIVTKAFMKYLKEEDIVYILNECIPNWKRVADDGHCARITRKGRPDDTHARTLENSKRYQL